MAFSQQAGAEVNWSHRKVDYLLRLLTISCTQSVVIGVKCLFVQGAHQSCGQIRLLRQKM
ncbi:Uncharacterized protein EbC_pEb17201100 (plasmid) [Erwinia billingiae Eb661]|uniref:Uncharacterized protein n=1 Tax=Erwinia billingiae (strain Eb661) TaxID=634500 RepID=D8MJW5_ERWBE|nr:Uncharacterized protein EbC_pEb17201100 [Erwinia billingiae Eb661]